MNLAKVGIKTFIIALGIVALTSCGAAGNDAPALAGTSWKLVSLNGEPAASGIDVTMNFDDETVSGSSGCNSYSGGYSLSGSTLSFGQLASTLMACEGPAMDMEMAFFGALQGDMTVALEGGQLTLSGADGQTLVFQAS